MPDALWRGVETTCGETRRPEQQVSSRYENALTIPGSDQRDAAGKEFAGSEVPRG